MSDNRRRRKSQHSGSDELSDSYDELNATKETQSSEHIEEHHDSEYDTAGSESDAGSQERTQRESGDGQEEEKPPKKLDDDEDRRNPQYIPKRGTFYEHDDRTADEINDEANETIVEREVKDKKVWKEKEDRWNHDRYNDEEQAPKSHAELIAVYGYDIRNEEGPPRARRRRRYGRGPNKYTRNWEDEDAYGKVLANAPVHKTNIRKGNRSGEEFPSLKSKDNDKDSVTPQDQPVITSAWYSNKNKTQTNKTQNFPPLNQTESQKARFKQYTNSQIMENKTPNEKNTIWKKDSKNPSQIQNANDSSTTTETEKIVIVKTTARDNRKPPQVQDSLNLGQTKSRGRGFKANTNNNTVVGSRVIEAKSKGRGPMNIDNRRSNVEHEQIVDDMKHMNVSTDGPSYHHSQRQNKHFYSQPSSQQHSSIVPQRMHQNHSQQQQSGPPQQSPQQQPSQSSQQQQDMGTNRPKRYSSLRQRPTMAEGPPTPAQPNYQPAPPQLPYYPPPQAGSSRAVLDTPGYPPGPYEQPAPVPAPAAPLAGQPVMPMPPPGAPTTTYAPPPPFLVPPPQFIPPQTAPPNIINYVPGPNGPIFQPNYQGYTPPGPPPPQEVGLFQPQGCTYYSPAQQQQQQQQQPVPLRRPKAAIPILPPPDNLQNRIRDRNIQQTPEQQQLIQQQQQQEQLVQQQLQQHQQQLIQEQQQELQQQQERKQLLERQQQEQMMKEQQLKQQQEQMLREQEQQEQILREQQQKQQQEQLLKEQQKEQKEQLEKEKYEERQEKSNEHEQVIEIKLQEDKQGTIVVEQTQSETKESISSSLSEKTEIKSVSEREVNETVNSTTEVDSKENLDENIGDIQPVIKPDTICEIKIDAIIVENEVDKKELTSKVEAIVAMKIPEINTSIEMSTSAIDEETKGFSTKTVELASSQNDTEISIKENAVIEETAA